MTNPPQFKGYKPIGLEEEDSPVVLNYEEYEAIRLSDFNLYGQVEAAQIMEVSRPTYARIYESARRKVAQAFVEGKAIIFEGGKVYFNSEWFFCNSCGCWFNHPSKEEEVKCCSLCGSSDIERYGGKNQQFETEDICVCPRCGRTKEYTLGVPLKEEICPDCNCRMIRKGVPRQHRFGNKNY
jgi:predicted DNA-binding protein (UPF0251 family)